MLKDLPEVPLQPTPSQRARFVIPPGQEPVIARMINPAAGLGDGWRFDRATIRDDSIHAYYQGPNGGARAILRARDDAPPEWPRTERFAVGLAAAKAGPPVTALYRAVLAAVRAGESAFTWREANGDASPAFDDGAADRERAAEAEVDLHLDLVPFLDLGIDFDHRGAFAEAMALRDRFVDYQSDPTYGITGWRGLALQALDGDPTRAATTEEDAGVFQDQSRYRRTEIAALCPITMSLLEQLLDFGNCRTVAFLLLEPGARIAPHVDGTGPPVMRSVNVALNMPEACRLVIDCNPDGSDNPYTHTVPFRDGSVVLLNVAKYHYVVNESPVPRIHVVARGALRLPATRVLALAEAQDNLRGTAAVEAALAVKRGSPRLPQASSSDGPTARLSPFVSALAGEARDRLLDLVDLGDRVLSARIAAAGAPQEWQGELEVHLPSGGRVALDVRSPTPARPAWFESAHFACSYRTQGTDPFADPGDGALLVALRQRLSRLDPPPPATAAPAVASLLSALDRYRPFAAVKDEDYRILFQAADHTVGILWLGFGCNQNCITCWQDRAWPAPPDEVFDRWLDELCAAGIGSLTLSGGEPTLHPRLPEWLRRAARARVHVTLETNAVRFVEPGVLEELRGAGLESVVISLHAADPGVSDALTQTPNTFALTVAGIRAALAAGLRVGIHCVVERRNFEALEAHARFVAEELRAGGRGIAHVSYSFPIPYRQRSFYEGAVVPLDELRPHLSAAARLLGAAGIDARFLGTSGFPPCAFDDPTSLAALLPDTVGAEMRVDHRLLEPCARCSLHARCLGVHKAYAEAHGGRGIAPVEG